jgi:hypothetical protein
MERKAKVLLVFLLCSCYVFVLGSSYCWSLSLEEIFSEISLFNPIGKLKDPVEGALPGLSIKGFLRNWTRVNTHGHTYNLGHGYRRTDDFPSIEWLAELEVRYHFSPNIQIVNVENFLYDAAFDWDKSGHYPHSVTRELEYYRTTERILRELYLDIFHGPWQLRLGKQQLVWGKMDGKVIDIINPTDLRYNIVFTQDNYEWTRLPLWLANIIYFGPNYFIQFLWIPDFEPSILPITGGPFSLNLPPLPPYFRIMTRDKPSAHIRNHEWGIRFNIQKRGWDASMIYFYTWDDSPTLFRRAVDLDPETNTPSAVYFEPKHTRLHQLGLDIDRNFWFLGKSWIFRGEFLYNINDYFSTVSEPLKEDGVTKKNWLLSAIAFETYWLKGEIWSLLQIQQKHVFSYSHNLRSLGKLQERDQWAFLLGLSKYFKFTDDRLGFIWTNVFFDDGSGGQRYQIKYAISDYLSGWIRYWGFYGRSDDRYGMFKDRDQLEFVFIYEF